MKNSFKNVAKAISRQVESASIKAMRAASNEAKHELIKTLKQETGLSTETIKNRMRAKKITARSPKALISVATKIGIPLDELKPKEKIVRSIPSRQASGRRGRPRARGYQGMSVKIGRQPRTVVPGVFLRTVRSGKLIAMGRKLAFTSGEYSRAKTPKYPTARIRTPIIREITQRQAKAIAERMKRTYESKLNASISKKLEDK